jgi:hypothetical protein
MVRRTVEATRQIGGDDLDVLRGRLDEVDDRNLAIVSEVLFPEHCATYIWNQVSRGADVQMYCDLRAHSVYSRQNRLRHAIHRSLSGH